MSGPESRFADAPPSPDAVAGLLGRCAAGDEAAFRRLYDIWGARLHGVALRITRDRALAADALHDALMQVWQRAHQFDPARGNAEAWIVSLVRYRAIDLARRHAREIPGYEPSEQEDESPSALARLVSSTEGAALRRCLQGIAEDRRRLITFAFVAGLSHSELAERLNLPLGTVKSWLRRALLSLRECLTS